MLKFSPLSVLPLVAFLFVSGLGSVTAGDRQPLVAPLPVPDLALETAGEWQPVLQRCSTRAPLFAVLPLVVEDEPAGRDVVAIDDNLVVENCREPLVAPLPLIVAEPVRIEQPLARRMPLVAPVPEPIRIEQPLARRMPLVAPIPNLAESTIETAAREESEPSREWFPSEPTRREAIEIARPPAPSLPETPQVTEIKRTELEVTAIEAPILIEETARSISPEPPLPSLELETPAEINVQRQPLIAPLPTVEIAQPIQLRLPLGEVREIVTPHIRTATREGVRLWSVAIENAKHAVMGRE
jgi:hypothetical protein